MSFDPTANQPTASSRSSASLGLVIDCEDCIARATAACKTCVVTYLVRDEQHSAVIIDLDEARALKALGDGGLVPRLRHATMEE